ncbi:hypothetical protein [Paenibacillus typhae]|uniref:hypothetical protein n=1 Tax=Paenibacillus typhae TaxID=1174501 RepID=UPI001C8E7741|nr:hypothetical protein [Paenibacillus typhae]MBY0011193.1 hypothetical protein [Paenibacillus typhae]
MTVHTYLRKTLKPLLAGVLMLALTACGSADEPEQSGLDSLQKRTAVLEQELAMQKQQIAELEQRIAALQAEDSAAPQPSPANSPSAETSGNGPADQGDDVRITFAQYQQLNIGMTYDEVRAIIGGDGQALSESAGMIVYSYLGSSYTGGNAVLTFSDGKLLNKAQSGLK